MENAHIVGRFDKDLDKLKNRILAMGALVAKQLNGATNALHTPDRGAIDLLVAEDRKVNGMNRSIAGRAERLIALRQPVALDLRAALLPINIAAELERIGDHAKSTAKRARKLDLNSIPREPIDLLTQMSKITQAQLTDAMVAYRDSDIDLVILVSEEDAELLRLMGDEPFDRENSGYDPEDARCYRFGKLNVLCCVNPKHFEVWSIGTDQLVKRKDGKGCRDAGPVGRDEAISYLHWLRAKHGIKEF